LHRTSPLPPAHRRVIRTNLLERPFGEAQRRTKVIPHAFGERAVLKLMYAALIRASERWRGIRVTEFEQRQFNAIRNELDHAHAERTAPAISPNVPTTPTRLSQRETDLTGPRILLLDEATSHLDDDNERTINAAIRMLTIARVIVAHCRSTIDMADRIVPIWPQSASRSHSAARQEMPSRPCTISAE
jgi:hypothetical protein